MSLKYVGETALQENIVKTKEHVESVRATLDAAKQDVIQVTSLGSATADKVGIAYQYMGADTASLKHGWFYEAVEVTPATDPATYTWQEFEFGGGLPYATTAPSNPENGDAFLYVGQTTGAFTKGDIYQYNAGIQLYGWVFDDQGTQYDVYTLSETPSVNDSIYTDYGTETEYKVASYDSTNNSIEILGTDYVRDSSYDTVAGAGWVRISLSAGTGVTIDANRNLNVPMATTHSPGLAKGGDGTYIGDYGEVNVYQRLREGSVEAPGSTVRINDYDSLFVMNTDTYGGYIVGGIYKLQIDGVTPEGTENPSEEGWYEYDGRHGDEREYVLSEDTTVDGGKDYFTIAWALVSASNTTFNADDFDVVDDTVSLDVTQRSFTGTSAEWEAVVDKSIYTIVNLTDDESSKPLALYADMAVGTIVPFGGSTSVNGFLLCDGSEYDREDYPELFEVIGTSFGTPSANTKFKVPDLREATTKGVGLTGLSNNHYDADGLALGEFIDDRFQDHNHMINRISGTSGPYYGTDISPVDITNYAEGGGIMQVSDQRDYRYGATTEVKSVGVNYLIKARQVALPIDLERQVVEANEYSTAETIVGKWIDGKPIYRKCFSGSGRLSSFSATLTNADIITNSFCTIKAPTQVMGGLYSIGLSFTSSTGVIVGSDDYPASTYYHVIVEYTKTTDG